MNEEDVVEVNCKKCNKVIKTSPKGWARKYCKKCRKIVDVEYAKERYKKNTEKILRMKEELKLNPRKKFISCHICNKKILNTCHNKKYCSECKKKQHVKVSKNWTNKNPEKAKEIGLRRDPKKRSEYEKRIRREHPKMIKEKERKKYLKHGERIRNSSREYHIKNKDSIRDTKRKYRVSEHGRIMVLGHRLKRRAIQKKIIHNFSMKEWKSKLRKSKGICSGCEKFIGITSLHLDHNPPISKAPEGFIYTINEIHPLCNSCNSKKYNKIDRDAMMKLDYYKENSKND